MSVNLTASPFFLNDSQVDWVEKTVSSMTIEEKIGQLFFLMVPDDNPGLLSHLSSIQPGGAMLRPMMAKQVADAHQFLQSKVKIPLFLSANLEAGADGLAIEGTQVGHPLLIAATDDAEMAYKQGEVCIKESMSLGANMSFAPILDLNFNWENPIANIRSFGDDVERVSAMTRRYVDAIQDNGGFVTIKHFPGDGCDGRDQHVIKTINSLSYEDWTASFGKVYQDNIDNHATGLMVGHIALPAYFRHHQITDADELTPASLSYHLLNGLLREELGYNGLIMTDATLMAGFGAEGKRENLLPECIAAGNDMILFTRDLYEDFGFVMQGYHDGIITDERLHDALLRILGLKAKENMHLPTQESTEHRDIVGCAAHKAYAKEAADKGITLVQNDEGILPIDTAKVKKIGIISLGNEVDALHKIFSSDNMPTPTHQKFANKLEMKGFEVSLIDQSDPSQFIKSSTMSIKEFKAAYDLVIYFVKKDTKSNQTNLRVEFKSPIGFDAPWFVHEVPTMLISVANPYHQYDFSNVKTVINGYSPTEEVLEAIVNKMMGETEFTGTSPVTLDFTPFTGKISQ